MSSVNRVRLAGPAIKILENELKRFAENELKDKIENNSEIKINFENELSINNLEFKYNDKTMIFNNLNLKFKNYDKHNIWIKWLW